jgi:uncharacterized protein (TIGR03435 family)
MRNVDLLSLVAMAYGLYRYQLSAPDWLASTHVDISARMPQGIDADQYRRLLQTMLAERFHLAIHHESREMKIYNLTIAKDGPKMKPSPNPSVDGLQPPPLRPLPPPGYHGPAFLNIAAISMPRFAGYLSGFLDGPIHDSTGLEGDYEIKFRAGFGGTSSEPTANSSSLSIFDALPEQLGLRLVPKKEQVDIVVVDSIDKSPTEN